VHCFVYKYILAQSSLKAIKVRLVAHFYKAKIPEIFLNAATLK